MWQRWKWWLVSAALVALVIGGYMLVSTLVEQAKEEARAEAMEQNTIQLQKERKEWERQFSLLKTQYESQLQALTQRQQELEASVLHRGQAFTQQAADLRQSHELGDVVEQLKRYLNLSVQTQGDKVSLAPADAQDLLISRLELQKVKADVSDLQTQLVLEKQKTDAYSQLIVQYEERHKKDTLQLDSMQQTMDAYKKAVKGTKWKRFLGKVRDVGMGIVVGAIGTLIAK